MLLTALLHPAYQIQNEKSNEKKHVHVWWFCIRVLCWKLKVQKNNCSALINEFEWQRTFFSLPSWIPLRRVFIVLFNKNCFHHIFWPCKHFICLSITSQCVGVCECVKRYNMFYRRFICTHEQNFMFECKNFVAWLHDLYLFFIPTPNSSK